MVMVMLLVNENDHRNRCLKAYLTSFYATKVINFDKKKSLVVTIFVIGVFCSAIKFNQMV